MDGSTDPITAPLALPVPTGDALHSYLSAIADIPLLDAERERELARKWRHHHDIQAVQQLVMANLRFVVYIARGYAGYGLALGDLIQEGNIGLMKAVRRFDPERGYRLTSFAVHWIRAEIHEFVIRNWRIVKIATTKAQRKLFFRLRGLKHRLGWMNASETQAIARELNVSAAEVSEMEGRLAQPDAGFGGAADRPALTPEHYLPAAETASGELEQAQEEGEQQLQLQRALSTLDERSRDIVTRRWLIGHKTGLQELATEYGVSAERIRQIQDRAFDQMRAHIEQGAAGAPA